MNGEKFKKKMYGNWRIKGIKLNGVPEKVWK